MRLFTIGYEHTTVDALVERLQAAGVEQLVDVRALPLSRRPGFSKTALAGRLESAGIDYLHLRALGTPPDGRAAARRHDDAALRRIYEARLAEPESVEALARLEEVASRRPTAILCVEREPQHCHRSIIAERFEARGWAIEHLATPL